MIIVAEGLIKHGIEIGALTGIKGVKQAGWDGSDSGRGGITGEGITEHAGAESAEISDGAGIDGAKQVGWDGGCDGSNSVAFEGADKHACKICVGGRSDGAKEICGDSGDDRVFCVPSEGTIEYISEVGAIASIEVVEKIVRDGGNG